MRPVMEIAACQRPCASRNTQSSCFSAQALKKSRHSAFATDADVLIFDPEMICFTAPSILMDTMLELGTVSSTSRHKLTSCHSPSLEYQDTRPQSQVHAADSAPCESRPAYPLLAPA